MVSPRFSCDLARLQLALDDRLREDAHQDLASHLEQCGECREQLESLAAGRDWWRKAQSHLATVEDGLPGRLTNTGRPGRPSSEGAFDDARPDQQPWLGFLAPSDDGAFIGRLGGYQVSDVIGSGGFGVVLKAFDAALNRFVAVKVLAPHLAASGAARRRFAREAQAAAAVVHEHVVAIHAVAENDGLPYLVMPYIAGCSLQERLDRQGPLELKEILRIGMQVAAGLAAAHAQGLVHRDIKPANILLENGVERVKITDFGLARTIDDASLTQSGVVAGTPQYMAPEQARGEPADHRSDLFSLGSVLYTMATGRSPFRAETFLGVWRRLCEDMPRPIRETNPEIPDWFAEIVETLHAKDPAERFQSAEEVSDLLSRHLAHLQQPALAPRPARLRRARWRRAMRLLRRGALIAAPAVVCLAAAVHWWPPSETTHQRAEGQPVAVDSREQPRDSDHEWQRPIAGWNQIDREVAETDHAITEVEQQLQRPAASVISPQTISAQAIDAEADAVERRWAEGVP
ncbi:MAG TPA: serine/threonine-protein kinase [Pirellulales bacterium]|nr:serine/threonine-protein kinase [Pirellulales bacterium]